MLENIGAERAVPAESPGDSRAIALALMTEALAHLDRDAGSPAIIGACLQLAIDKLWACSPQDRASA